MRKKVLISTGGSGGHVVPALILREHLKEKFDIFLTSDQRGFKYIEGDENNFNIINALPISRNIFLIPWAIIIFFFAIIKSLFLIKKNKIKIIISTGGYMSFPVCIAAKMALCKIVLFEPNMVIGRSNLFLLRACSFILCYSNQIKNFPDKFKHKIKLISPLLRKKIYFEKKNVNNHFEGNIKILIIGGSQGADYFQNNFKNTIFNLSKKFNLEVFHQVNKKNEKDLIYFYEKNKIKYNLFYFKNDLYKLITESNFCITRAGASSLAELTHLNLPFVAIPYPYAKDNHQYYNALQYKSLNCCWMLEQSPNISNDLYNLILTSILDKKDFQKKIDAMKKISYENSWNNINQKIIRIINEN